MSTKQKTPLADFYGSKFRPKVKRAHSASYVHALDHTVNRVASWRDGICIEDIDARCLLDFDRHLKDLGNSDATRMNHVLRVKRIVNENRSYAFISGRTQWRFAEQALCAEPPGHFGKFYVEAYEPKQHVTPVSQRNTRRIVKHFAAWCGAPIKLAAIDEVLVKRFEAHEQRRGCKPEVARNSAARIRLIVNDWKSGRLPPLTERPLPKCNAGTVQHFVVSNYVSDKRNRKRSRSTIAKISQTIRLFHVYCGNKGLPFAKFTDQFCTDFLHSCLANGDEGRPLRPNAVNIAYRYTLMQISRAAVKAGLMKRRLVLEPIAPLKRRPRTSANGHANPATVAASDQWTDYRLTGDWVKVFHRSWSVISRRIRDGKSRGERRPGTWQYRFPISELPAAPNNPR